MCRILQQKYIVWSMRSRRSYLLVKIQEHVCSKCDTDYSHPWCLQSCGNLGRLVSLGIIAILLRTLEKRSGCGGVKQRKGPKAAPTPAKDPVPRSRQDSLTANVVAGPVSERYMHVHNHCATQFTVYILPFVA